MIRRFLVVLYLMALAAGGTITAIWLSKVPHIDRSGGMIVLCTLEVAGFTSVNLCLRWLRWQFLVRMLGVQVRTKESFKIYFATMPAILTPFYVGELIRGYLLERRTKGAFRAGAISWFIERISDFVIVLGILFISNRSYVFVLSLTLLYLVAASLAIGKFTRRTYGRSWIYVVFLFTVTVASWFLPAIALGLATRTLGYSLPFIDGTRAFASGTLLGGFSGIPLGMGVTGSTTINSLASSGVPSDIAIVAVAVFRAGTSWFALAIGLIALFHWRKEFRSDNVADHHFDDIAAGYDKQIPGHIRDRLLGRKIFINCQWIKAAGIELGAHGLDIGCGHGWYAMEMARAGYIMQGLDASAGQISRAREESKKAGLDIDFRCLDAAELPYESESFDFVYSINVLHHITDLVARERAFSEIVRILKPGGIFILHEINVENPLFEAYMGYVFPLIRDIDDGTEKWLRPTSLPHIPNAQWDDNKQYFTFLPDFAPGIIVKLLLPLEKRLESSRYRHLSAHYSAILVRDRN